MKTLNNIRDVFETCQRSVSVHHNLITSLKALYDKYDDEERFFTEFLDLLKHSLVSGDVKSTAINRTLEFAARFAQYLCPSSGDPEDPDATDIEPQEVHPFFKSLFEFLLDSQDAGSQVVRIRCCQLLNKLLLHLGQNAYLEDELYDRMYRAMMERIVDVSPTVRVQAVFALSRLQDPKDKECPVIKAYQFHLQNDPSADVRRAVLLNIAGNSATLPSVIDRIRDCSAAVRRRAFLFLTKVHIKSISIKERRRLLKEGLQDRDDRVKEAVQKDLLQFWLRLLKGSATALLGCLYVVRCVDVAVLVVKALCCETSFSDLVDSLGLAEDSRLIPAEELTPERVILWRVLCEHLRDQGPEAHLERVTPDVPALCQLMEQLNAAAPPDDDEQQPGRDAAAHRFVLTQLVTLASGLELWDEFGRRTLAATVERLLRSDRLDFELVPPLVKLYRCAVPAPAARLRALVETISEIRAPLTPASQPAVADPAPVTPRAAETPAAGADRAAQQRRLQRAQLRVQQNVLRDQLDAAVAAGDFVEAQRLHERQAQLQEEERQLQCVDISTASEPADAGAPDADADAEEDGCTERDDPYTLIKSLSLLAELARPGELSRLPPELVSLVETLVLPSVCREESAVRQAAVVALGVCCILSRELAERHLVLFVQVAHVDTWEVQRDALEVVFDLLLVHGMALATLNDEAETDDMTALVTELTGMLNSPSVEMRGLVAEGLCRLLMCSRIASARLLERLLLMWYNPVHDGDHFLRNMLGVFFPSFGAASYKNQAMLADAMLPTLTTLIDAPMTSPLVEVDVDDVARFFIQLTDSARLPPTERERTAGAGCVHQELGYKMLHMLLDRESSSILTRLLAKSVNQLQLADAKSAALRDLVYLAGQAIGECGDPYFYATAEFGQRKNQLRKFRTMVTTLLDGRPEEAATPAATPAPGRRRVDAQADDSEATITEDETEVEIDTGLDADSCQASPQRTLTETTGVVPETPEQDITRGEEVFLGASSQDSDEFSACLADETVVSRRGLSTSQDGASLKRAAETPPPRTRPPPGRLSRRLPAGDKRFKQPTGSPAVVPAKKQRQQAASVSATPAQANVRRARPARGGSAPAPAPDSPAISEVSSSAVGSDSPLAVGSPGSDSEDRAATPDSVFSTGRRGTADSKRVVPDTPDSEVSTASSRPARRQAAGAANTRAKLPSSSGEVRRSARAARGATPDSCVSGATMSTRSTRSSRGSNSEAAAVAAGSDKPARRRNTRRAQKL